MNALPSRKGKTTKRKYIDDSPMEYTVIDEIIIPSSNNPQKAFYLHKLKFKEGREEIRISYYIIAHKPRMQGKWAYGQSAPMMTKQEFELIISEAVKNGWVQLKVE